MSLRIEKASPATTLQDLGRQGAQHIGYSQSGAADEQAFLWANKLLGNPANSATLEIMMGPFVGSFEQSALIAITGAARHVFINGQRRTTWRSLKINAGDELRIPFPDAGVMTYLAVAEGFSSARNFQSVSTVPREARDDEKHSLKSGDVLHYQATNNLRHNTKFVPPRYIEDFQSDLHAQVILNPDYAADHDILSSIVNQPFTIDNDSNKMAYRLKGEPVNDLTNGPFFSRATPLGTIQLPKDGQPIVLLKDRQTIGGYPQIGFLSQRDCFRLSQRRPGQQITFKVADRETCQAELIKLYRFFNV